MVLRIHFTADDLCRVRVATGPHPLWETILSVNSLQSPKLPSRHWDWRASVAADGKRAPEARRRLRAAATVVPVSGNFPDFLTPSLAGSDFEEHCDAILEVPKDVVRDDLTKTFRHRPAPPLWARNLYDHGKLRGLVGVLRDYHHLAVEPTWSTVVQEVENDRAQYARRLLDGGVEALLRGLHPSIRWQNPVLEADYPADLTVDLAGRGLTVVPARFCWGAPVTFIDADRPPMLVCPASGDLPSPAPTGVTADRLGSLLGTTRARLLTELVVAGSTTELAKRLGTSPAAVSQHSKVLRDAGLLTTCRFGPSVRHALTPLGHDLLRG